MGLSHCITSFPIPILFGLVSPNSCVFLCIYNKIVKKCRFRDGLWTQPCLHALAGGFLTTNATWEDSAPNPILYNPSDPSPFTSVGHSLLISKMEIIPVGSIIVRINELRSNQSILKEISPEYSLEGLMLKLKLQYFGHLMWITDSLEKALMLGKTEGRRRRGQ